MADGGNMNIIIVGCGKIGAMLIEQLCSEGHNVAAIDRNPEKVEAISMKYDALGIVGNGASYTTQLEAGVEKADVFIAVAGQDEVNLLCCLLAKKAGNCNTIARVRNPVYRQEINIIKEEIKLSMSINPEFTAALEIARVLRFPSAIKIDTFEKGKIELIQYKLKEDSKLDGHSLSDISSTYKSNILICTVERGDEVYIPKGDFKLAANDTISIMATPRNLNDFFKKIGLTNHQVKNTLIVGGGEISYYLAVELLAMGVDVKIIEKEPEKCSFLSEQLPGAIVINGDETDQSLLLEEGIERVESFVSLTNFDEENILLSMYIRSKSNAKTVTKIHRITFDEIVEQLDLGSIICPQKITSESILQYVRAMQNSMGSNIETLYKIIENKAEALEFIIKKNAPVIGIPLQDLPLKKNIIIGAIVHKGNVFIPKGSDTISKGDRVIIITTNFQLYDISDILV